MTEVLTPVGAAKASPKKSSASSKTKTVRSKPNHPKTSEMVTAAISTLNDRSGSSYQAIKKYIVGTYAIDLDRLTPFIKKYLKSAVEQGDIIQTKGKGASGSFKLGAKLKAKPKKTTPSKVKKVEEKPVVKKSKATKTTSAEKKKTAAVAAKKSPVKKVSSTKVKIAVPKKTVAKTSAVKSPTKKTAKAPTSKPKAPKPKKITAKKTVKTAAK
ncbi:histone H1-like [Leptopilina heterotoma]|uniref:histone H1-like n=1 Tax=Leptopilina heterotoma TaxID=63436 RepID=UPI001CA970C6|nr:histone H1-like [Leptopilina heterotoma]